jgi:hypothetical protein
LPCITFFPIENHWVTDKLKIIRGIALWIRDFFLLLQPASEEGFKLKGWRREEKGRIYFKINIAKVEKIATFAARSEERKAE